MGILMEFLMEILMGILMGIWWKFLWWIQWDGLMTVLTVSRMYWRTKLVNLIFPSPGCTDTESNTTIYVTSLNHLINCYDLSRVSKSQLYELCWPKLFSDFAKFVQLSAIFFLLLTCKLENTWKISSSQPVNDANYVNTM